MIWVMTLMTFLGVFLFVVGAGWIILRVLYGWDDVDSE